MSENIQEEQFDIVDECGNPTGKSVSRSIAHKEGIKHRTAHVWVIDKSTNPIRVLLQKRAMNKDSFPGKLDTSSAGHIHAGDDPCESAVRELSEELGITAQTTDLTFIGTFDVSYEKEFHGNLFKDNEVAFVYTYEKMIDVSKLVLQKEEVDAVEWIALPELLSARQNNDSRFCVPRGGLALLEAYLQ